MPRFIVTTGSKYDPFTYDELAKPLMQMQEAQNASIESYEKLASDTAALERYITNNPEDSEARAMYDNYTKNLQTLTDNLYNTGYNSDRRRELARAREGFNQDITRIATAIKDRQDRGLEYRKMKREHPEMILGKDPSTGGLNDYLRNPLYGTDYYSYSGTQFSQEVLTEAKARAAELMEDPRIIKDPKLKGYLTQIIDETFNNKQVDDAYAAARSYYNGRDISANLDPTSKVLYDTLVTQMEHTGAPKAYGEQRLSGDELIRLLDYGRIGLAGAIVKPTVNNLKDLEWEERMARGRIAYAHSLDQPAPPASPRIDTNTERGTPGPNYDKARNEVDKALRKGDDREIVTKDGKVVRSVAEASYIVHNGERRAQVSSEIGFDPMAVKSNAITPKKSWTQGVATENGRTIYTRYNPRTKSVEVSPTGKANDWYTDSNRTRMFNATVAETTRREQWYATNEPELYSQAKIDPVDEANIYKRNNSPAGTTLLTFEDEMMSRPENMVQDYTETYVAREGTDNGANGIRSRIGAFLSPLFKFNDKGEIVKDPDARAYNGQPSYGMHYLTPSKTVEDKAILDANDVFKFDKEGKIANIYSIALDKGALRNGYFIIHLSDSNKDVAVGINSLKSDSLVADFNTAIKYVAGVQEDYVSEGYNWTSSAEQEVVNAANEWLAMQIYNTLGYDLNVQTQGPTAAKNVNGTIVIENKKKK